MALYGKRIFISILIATLITWPLPPMAVGASTNETAYWSDVHTGIQSFGGQILQLQQKYLTQKQAIADQLNRQKYIQANQPKAESSKYFPKCLIPPSNPTLPTSLCEISSAQANAGLASSIVSNGQTAIEMAKKYQQQFYTPMQQKAQNTNYPIGLQCLEESRDELLNQMQDKLNALDAYIGQINQENQQLRDQANNFLETIKEANYQLNGGNPDTNTKQAFDLQKSLGAACTNTLGVSAMDNSRGLRGLKSNIDQNFKPQADKILAAHSDVAGTNNEGGRLFNQQIKDIQQYLQKYGIEGLGNHVENGRGIGLIPASQVATIVKRFEGDLQTESANLQKDLQNYGIAVPALDANFLAKSKSITGGSQGNQIENTIITNCINGQGEQALGIPLESLIASITQKNVSKTAGSTAHDYQNQLRKIWHSNNSYQNKLKLTQQLDHKIGQKAGISVTYQDVDNQQRQIKELPSAYFARAVDKCKTQYQQMGNSSDGRSGNAQTQSATKALAALQKNVETFSSNVVGALKNELLNCRNQTVSLDQCSSSLDPGQGNFCWQQATTCASQINNCASKTQDLINAKVTIANQAAHNYNQNLKAFITKQQLFLKTVQNRIFADANYLRQMFPNNNFNYQGSGADIFVPMPELTTGQGELAGVSLLGGGNTEQNLQGLSDALNKMKGIVTSQRDSIKQSLDKYIQEVADNIKQNEQRWSELINQCQQAIASYQQQQAAAAQAQQEAAAAAAKQLQDDLAQLNKICRQFSEIQGNPNGACDSKISSLINAIGEATIEIDDTIEQGAYQYNAYCNNVQNAKADSKEEKVDVCKSYCSSTWEQMRDGMRDKILDALPPSINETKVKKYLNDKLLKEEDEDTIVHGAFLDESSTSDRKARGILKTVPELKDHPKLVKAIESYKTNMAAVKKAFEDAQTNFKDLDAKAKDAKSLCAIRDLEIKQIQVDEFPENTNKKKESTKKDDKEKDTPTPNTATNPSDKSPPQAAPQEEKTAKEQSDTDKHITELIQLAEKFNKAASTPNSKRAKGILEEFNKKMVEYFPQKTINVLTNVNEQTRSIDIGDIKKLGQPPASNAGSPTSSFLQRIWRFTNQALNPAAMAADDDKGAILLGGKPAKKFSEREQELRGKYDGRYSGEICEAYKTMEKVIERAQQETDQKVLGDEFEVDCKAIADDYKALYDTSTGAGGNNVLGI